MNRLTFANFKTSKVLFATLILVMSLRITKCWDFRPIFVIHDGLLPSAGSRRPPFSSAFGVRTTKASMSVAVQDRPRISKNQLLAVSFGFRQMTAFIGKDQGWKAEMPSVLAACKSGSSFVASGRLRRCASSRYEAS